MSQIRFFSDEQEALITEFQEKWQNISLSSEPIDRKQAKAALEEVYAVMKKSAPEIIFCDSPRSALLELDAYVSQIEVAQVVSKSPEEVFQGLNFVKLFVNTIWHIIKSKKKQKKAKVKTIYNLIQELSRQPNKSLAKHIDTILPKDLTTQQIVEQSFWDASPLFEALGKQQASQGEPDLQKTLQTKPSQEWQESFSQTAIALEQQLSWLPGKKWFFRQWLKRFLQGAISSKITGVEQPKFREIFYNSLSFPQLKFLAENPPIITPNIAANYCIWLDFAFSVLNYPCKLQHWQALQNLVCNCGWIFVVDNICYICDRPTKILINADGQIHGEGEPALEYSDGYKAYVYNGFTLPEKYGAINPNQWQTEWVLEEENKQLQKILIQGISVVRLCQELPLIKLEETGEYTLFKLDESTGTKVTHILRRINSDTGETKAVLVSWTSRNLTQAIQYAHKNYSAEDFPLPNS